MNRLRQIRNPRRRQLGRYSLRHWRNGVVSEDEARFDGLASVKNCELTAAGQIRSRPNVCTPDAPMSVKDYSGTVVKLRSRPLPFAWEYQGTAESHLIAAFEMSDGKTVIAYLNRQVSDTVWEQLEVLDSTNEVFFSRASDYIIITNGTVSFIDLTKSTLAITRPTFVDDPDEFASFTPKEGTGVASVPYEFDWNDRIGTTPAGTIFQRFQQGPGTLRRYLLAAAPGALFSWGAISADVDNNLTAGSLYIHAVTGTGKEARVGAEKVITIPDQNLLLNPDGSFAGVMASNGTTLVVIYKKNNTVVARFGVLDTDTQTVSWASGTSTLLTPATLFIEAVAINNETLVLRTRAFTTQVISLHFATLAGIGSSTTATTASNGVSFAGVGKMFIQDTHLIYEATLPNSLQRVTHFATMSGSGVDTTISDAFQAIQFQFSRRASSSQLFPDAYDNRTLYRTSYDPDRNHAEDIFVGELLGGVVVSDSDDPATRATFEYRYAYSIQTDFGETALSPIRSISTTTLRHNWHKDQFWITLNVPRPTLTINHGFNIYVGLAREGVLYRLVSNWKPVVGDTFVDNGQEIVDYNPTSPQTNSTLFPKAKYSAGLKKRVILFGDIDQPNRVHFGGARDILNFTVTDDSGNVDIGDVTEEVMSVIPTTLVSRQAGFMVNTVEGDASSGREYFLTETARTTPTGRVVTDFAVDNTGNTGTVSPHAVVAYNQSVYKPSTDGFKVYGPQSALGGVFGTDNIDGFIETRSLNLRYKEMTHSNGVEFNHKIYWSVSSAGRLDQIWVLDLRQNRGAWMTDLEIPSDYLVVANSSDGKQQLLIFKDNKMCYYSDDPGENFAWRFKIRNIYCPPFRGDDTSIRNYALVKGWLTVYDLRGEIRLKIVGRTIDEIEKVLVDKTFEPVAGVPGQTQQPGSPVAPPATARARRIPIPLNINEVVNYIDVEVLSERDDARCMVTDFSFNYKFAGDTNFEQSVIE